MRTSTHRSSIVILALALASALGCNRDKGLSGDPSADKGDAPAAGANYLADTTSVPGKLKAKIAGPVRLLELTVHPDVVTAQIQDPKKKANVDEYELRDGRLGEGVPVQFAGEAPTAADLDAATIDLASIDFAAVPRIAKDAIGQLKIDDGKVTHVVLRRNRPFGDDVRWRVYVAGARKSGSVEYDPAGIMKKVWN